MSRIVLVSNRVADLSRAAQAGGVVIAIADALRARNGLWLGWSGKIGEKSVVGGNSVVAKSLPPGSFVTGYPARPHREWMEVQAAVNRLPALLKKLRAKGD